MKQTITHYERELLEIFALQAEAASLMQRQTQTAVKHLLLMGDRPTYDDQDELDAFVYNRSITVDGLLANLRIDIADPLVQDTEDES
jgi:hypothetical protein